MKHFILIVQLCFSILIFAQNNVERKHLNLEKGVAVQGYDPVAYFSSNKAKKGNSKISLNYQGAIYYFASEENKTQFQKTPTKFEPQYGGYCAFAMGDYAKKVEIDPETFKIVDGKLYLFYNKFVTNTLKSWNKDEKNLRTKGDKNWSNIIKN